MRAHWLNEGEQVLVTGTQDVEAARVFASEDFDMADFLAYSETEGRAAAGCIVPANDHSDYSWWWREGGGGNRVKAVVFE